MRLREANTLSIEEVNFLGTSVCKSMFIAIYTTLKIPLNMEKLLEPDRSINYFVIQLSF